MFIYYSDSQMQIATQKVPTLSFSSYMSNQTYTQIYQDKWDDTTRVGEQAIYTDFENTRENFIVYCHISVILLYIVILL
jgi:hypothetical protein